MQGRPRHRVWHPTHERSAPWEPDLLLPTQLRVTWALTPERRLLLAVVEQALGDMRRPAVSDGDIVRTQAIAWVESDDEDPWSFRWCCRHLNLNVAAVRRALASRDYRPHLVPSLDERRHKRQITLRSAGIWT